MFYKGGGIPEAKRASELSELLGLHVSASQVCFGRGLLYPLIIIKLRTHE
jgi:hypothetical protein